MTPLEITAVVFTLVNVWLAIKENIWTWPTGIVSVVLYGVVFLQSKFYLNAGLQVVYLVLSIHGWYEWLHGGANHGELRVRRASARQWLGCAVAGVALTLGLYWISLKVSGAAPIQDAITTGFSIVAQWMLNEKILENWLIWFSVDVIYVAMFMAGHLTATAVLYGFFCVLCVKGIIDWRKSLASA